MSLTDLDVKTSYTGDNATVNFAIPFTIVKDDSAETVVYTRDESSSPPTVSQKTEGVDYNLTGAADQDSFHTTVTFVSAPATGIKVFVVRSTALTQTLDHTANGQFKLEDQECALDKLTAIAQELSEKLTRALLFNITSGDSDVALPDIEADKVLKVNSGGTALEWKSVADLLNITDALAASNNLSDLASVATALVNLGIAPLSTPTNIAFTDGMSATDYTGLTFDGTAANFVTIEFASNQGAGTKMNRFTVEFFYDGSNWFQSNGSSRYPSTMSVKDITISFSESGANNKDLQVRLATDAGSGNGNIQAKSHTYLVS